MWRWSAGFPPSAALPLGTYLPVRKPEFINAALNYAAHLSAQLRGGLALKLGRPGNRSPPAHPPLPPEPQLPGVGWRRQGGKISGREAVRGWRSSNLIVAGAEGLLGQEAGPEKRKGQFWLLTTASPELSLIIRPILCSIQSSCLGEVGPEKTWPLEWATLLP